MKPFRYTGSKRDERNRWSIREIEFDRECERNRGPLMESRKILLLEGEGDLSVITALAGSTESISRNGAGRYPVPAKVMSMPALLDPEFLATVASESGLDILGMVLDADLDPSQQLDKLRRACGADWKGRFRKSFPRMD